MPKYGDDLLLLCRGLQANGAQIFWDTLYSKKTIVSACRIFGIGNKQNQHREKSWQQAFRDLLALRSPKIDACLTTADSGSRTAAGSC